MPKEMKKKSSSRASPMSARPSLESEIKQSQETGVLRVKERPNKPLPPSSSRNPPSTVRRGLAPSSREQKADDEDEADEDAEDPSDMVPQALSRKIIQQAQSQQKEEEEDGEDEDDDAPDADLSARDRALFRLRAPHPPSVSALDDEEDDDEEGDEDQSERGDEVEDVELTAEDEASLALFLPSSTASRRNLGELIMAKLSAASAASPTPASEPPLDPKVTAVYAQVATYLSHYTSGKVPKAFKIIPSLVNWEAVLYLTQPPGWTPQAVSAATRLFASNLNERMAQRYYALVLLPRVRDDISAHGRLHYHLYQAMRRALFKPAAFFRGIVLPWCEDGLTVKEGVILSSVLAKYSIPPLHAAVCMMKLCEMEYSGPVQLVLKTLMNKKYSLPVKVVEALVGYYEGFGKDERRMPLIWHQSLLVLVQRYGAEMTEGQVRRIRDLTRMQVHALVTKEVRRELMRVKERRTAGVAVAAPHSLPVPVPMET